MAIKAANCCNYFAALTPSAPTGGVLPELVGGASVVKFARTRRSRRFLGLLKATNGGSGRARFSL